MTVLLILYLIGACITFAIMFVGFLITNQTNRYTGRGWKSRARFLGWSVLYSAGWPIVLLLAGGSWAWAFVARWWSVRRMD